MIGKDLNNQEKLEAIYKMTIENNDILRTIRRQHYFANFLSILYWLMILGAIGGTYYFVKPFISAFSGSSGKIEETVGDFNQIRNQLPQANLITQWINRYRSKTATGTDVQMPNNGVIDASTTGQ